MNYIVIWVRLSAWNHYMGYLTKRWPYTVLKVISFRILKLLLLIDWLVAVLRKCDVILMDGILYRGCYFFSTKSCGILSLYIRFWIFIIICLLLGQVVYHMLITQQVWSKECFGWENCMLSFSWFSENCDLCLEPLR